MDLPAFDTNRYPAYHAHPPLPYASPTSPDTNRQHLRDLVDNQTIHLNLRGLPWEDCSNETAILTPHVRRSPFEDKAMTSHLDTVSCWKGLSYAQARELAIWYHIFHRCLMYLVEQNLREVIVEDLIASPEPFVNAFLVPRMLQCLRIHSRRIIDVDISALVRDMIIRLDECYAHTDMSEMVGWSSSIGGLWSFLHAFLRNQDCLLETNEGTYMIFDFKSHYSGEAFYVSGEAAWHTPNVRFLDLPVSLPSGVEYCIVPSLPNKPYPKSTLPGAFPDDIHLQISRSDFELVWDRQGECYRVLVPELMESKTGETTLCATTTTEFPDGVRFERSSRWNLKLHVTCPEPPPSYGTANDGNSIVQDLLWRHQELYEKMRTLDSSPLGLRPNITGATRRQLSTVIHDWAHSYTSTPLSKTHHSKQRHDSVIFTPSKSNPGSPNEMTDNSLLSSNKRSPQKRKISKLGSFRNVSENSVTRNFVHSSPRLAHKRPCRHDSMIDSSPPGFRIFEDKEMKNDINYAANWDSEEEDPVINRRPGDHSSEFIPRLIQRTSRSPLFSSEGDDIPHTFYRAADPQIRIRTPSETKSSQFRHHDCGEFGNLSDIDTIPMHSADGHHRGSSSDHSDDVESLQTRIRNNYIEFEARRKRKDAGMEGSSGLDPDDRRAFEEIFLEESEGEWTSGTDFEGVSVRELVVRNA